MPALIKVSEESAAGTIREGIIYLSYAKLN